MNSNHDACVRELSFLHQSTCEIRYTFTFALSQKKVKMDQDGYVDQFVSEVHLDFRPSLVAADSISDSFSKEKFVTRIPLFIESFKRNSKAFTECDVCDENYDKDKKQISSKKQKLDEDGDFELNREEDSKIERHTKLSFVHCRRTNLSDVGLQIWRASLFLLDFIFSSTNNPDDGDCTLFDDDCYCIELGCGIGMCSSILQMMEMKSLIATDKDSEILDLCSENMKFQLENSFLAEYMPRADNNQENILSPEQCKKLDWFEISKIYDMLDIKKSNETTTLMSHLETYLGEGLGNKQNQSLTSSYAWSKQDILKLKKTDRIIAADCIYDETLTLWLFKTLMILCLVSEASEIRVFFAVEKRLNFTLEDLDVASPCYNHFIKLMGELVQNDKSWKIGGSFEVKQIKQFEQFLGYERSELLELWEICYTRN